MPRNRGFQIITPITCLALVQLDGEIKTRITIFLTVCARRKDAVITPASIRWSAITSRTVCSVLFHLEHCTVSRY